MNVSQLAAHALFAQKAKIFLVVIYDQKPGMVVFKNAPCPRPGGNKPA